MRQWIRVVTSSGHKDLISTKETVGLVEGQNKAVAGICHYNRAAATNLPPVSDLQVVEYYISITNLLYLVM